MRRTFQTYRNTFALLLLISSALLVSCGNKHKLSENQEGIIEFDTRGVDEKHPLFGVAPSTAVLKFKDNKFIIEMSTMGMFNTSIIGDSKAKTMVQTVKFMNIKQACVENEKELALDNQNYRLKIEETEETKEIAGLTCYKIRVTKLDEDKASFDAWYTKDLGMENCNSLTPYAPVKGILMDYRIKKMGMEMHFAAKTYSHVEINNQTFDIPSGMKIVSKEEMSNFFKELE